MSTTTAPSPSDGVTGQMDGQQVLTYFGHLSPRVRRMELAPWQEPDDEFEGFVPTYNPPSFALQDNAFRVSRTSRVRPRLHHSHLHLTRFDTQLALFYQPRGYLYPFVSFQANILPRRTLNYFTKP